MHRLGVHPERGAGDGIGREVILAVERSDFPVIKAVTVYLAMLTMFINLLVDVMYKFVDPRVSFK